MVASWRFCCKSCLKIGCEAVLCSSREVTGQAPFQQFLSLGLEDTVFMTKKSIGSICKFMCLIIKRIYVCEI